MNALALLSQARDVARWISLGVRRDELVAWQGGILPTLTEARWQEIMPAHALAVQDALPEHVPIAQPAPPVISEHLRFHGVRR